jgi:hypothetical protein
MCEALYYSFNWRLQNMKFRFIYLTGDYNVWGFILFVELEITGYEVPYY